jgi:dTDP-4-amino-4,6-dideoxygalactose transaminase
VSRDDFIVFGRPLIDEAEIADVVMCLRSGWLGTGPRVDRFERMLEAYTGAQHVRCCRHARRRSSSACARSGSGRATRSSCPR